MGLRPGNSKRGWAWLGEYDPGNVVKFAPNLVGQSMTGCLVRFDIFLSLSKQCFNAGSRSSDQPRGTPLEPSLPGFACLGPCDRDRQVEISLGPAAKATVDQPHCMTHAG